MIFKNKVEAIFGDDPEITVSYDEEDVFLRLLVANQSKAEALSKILGTSRQLGNVELKISVIPANESESKVELFRRAFAGNPAVSEVTSVDVAGFSADYVIFEPEVVQYRSDDLSSIYGIDTTVYEKIADDIFEDHNGVFFCTAPKLSLGTPLGEWP